MLWVVLEEEEKKQANVDMLLDVAKLTSWRDQDSNGLPKHLTVFRQ